MTFSRLWLLNFIWFLPFLIFLFIFSGRKQKQALKGFAEDNLLLRLCAPEGQSRRVIRSIFLILAVGLIILSIAGPRWGEHIQEVTQKGVDIIVCVDVSTSMLVEDVKPNRLERAKREVMDLIKVIQGDRMGLVAFAGKAFLQCPLTLDYNALVMFLNQLSPDLIPVYGTDLGDAINTAHASFNTESATDKVMLLITDGEDNEERGQMAAEKAGDSGIKIFVFGIGDPSGGPVPQMGKGGFEKDKAGKLVLSRLEEQTLKEIAKVSGGSYVRSIEGDMDLDRLYFDGIRKKTEAGILKTGKIKIFEERFYIFLIVALIVLLLEGFLDERLFQKRIH